MRVSKYFRLDGKNEKLKTNQRYLKFLKNDKKIQNGFLFKKSLVGWKIIKPYRGLKTLVENEINLTFKPYYDETLLKDKLIR